ncbi:5-oxoprolinase/urea amidolyase family protein [Salinisphaera sp. RV14]|uniref:5-oxoprolinase subunit B/C family protein n=1 Tax=unclassified Salinisphaera TaxID=2649847 RepID=UPI003F8303B9
MSGGPIRWVGSRAVMVERDTLDEVLALHAYLLDHPLPGQIDLVPAAKTLLIKCDSHRNAARAHAAVHDIHAPPIEQTDGKTVEIEVVYDGEDLETVAELTGLGVDGVIEAHTRQTWRAAFSGFAPGFVYLAAEDDTLDVPRRDSPRTAVPAGSVALAGPFSAVYPRRSPGGWQLIGRTDARVWDIEREEPALIQAGDLVRYKAVDRLQREQGNEATARADAPDTVAEPALEIVDPGLQSLIEDLGRPGLSHLGVSVSGAADETAARQANRLVGNPADDAVIETLLGGLTIRAHGDLTLARTGADTQATIDSERGPRTAPLRAPFALHDGETLTLATPQRGLRSYLAARGGLDVPAVLGSRSHDALSGIGPEPLAAGRVLPVGAAGPSHIVGAPEPTTLAERDEDNTLVLRVVLGPRDDWFSPATRARFTRQRWRATEQSNRIGVRLNLDTDNDAAALERDRDGELPSEGTVPGALQIPPSGLPVLFLKDHPVTGGYPVIAVVIAEDLPLAAQIAPGEAVRFAVVDPDTLAPIEDDQDDGRPPAEESP